jgi:hypothetical protein
VGSRVVIAVVVVLLFCACAPPVVQRPLDGAPPSVDGGASSKEGGGPPATLGVPPTLSANNPSPAGSPGQVTLSSPIPSPSPSPEPGYVIVATDGRGANLRDAPGTSSRVITTLAEGTAVDVFPDQTTVGGQAWRKIRGANREGWVVAPVVRRR